jgi:hypothetical protein
MQNGQIPSKVPVPEKQGSPGPATPSQNGHTPGAAIKGFDGGLKGGKVKI